MGSYLDEILAFHCPRWDELPDIDLYMDQVVSFIESRLAVFAFGQDKLITSTMINNYVKQRIIVPPQRKRYQRRQTAKLMVICILKRCFSITEINDMCNIVLKSINNFDAYNIFCRELEASLVATFTHTLPDESAEDITPEMAIFKSVLRAFSNKLYAQCVLEIQKEQLELN
jgi:hypothetical protein